MHQQSNANEATRAGKGGVNNLFSRYYATSLRVAHRLLRSREDAEDAVQTAYCSAFRTLHQFRGEASFKTWVNRIVVNCCLQEIRRRRARHLVAIDGAARGVRRLESSSSTPESLCSLRGLEGAYASAISGLPTRLKDVYVPCVLSGSTIDGVAHDLGLTGAAAKARLFRARKKVEHSPQLVVYRRAFQW